MPPLKRTLRATAPPEQSRQSSRLLPTRRAREDAVDNAASIRTQLPSYGMADRQSVLPVRSLAATNGTRSHSPAPSYRTVDDPIAPTSSRNFYRGPQTIASDERSVNALLPATTKSRLNREPDHNAEYNNGFAFFQKAIGENDKVALQRLIDRGADLNAVDHDGWPPLHVVAVYRHATAMAQMLINAGADIHMTDSVARTPLFPAALCGREKVVAMLLDAGAEIDVTDINGLTPLHEAVLLGGKAVVQMLLLRGADVNIASTDGSTPLHRATLAFPGDKAVVAMLIAHGAHVNAADLNGETPLFNAIRARKKAATELLIDAGADVNVVDQKGWSPLQYAVDGNYKAGIKILVNRGAGANTITKTG